jgi:hypothetical protein
MSEIYLVNMDDAYLGQGIVELRLSQGNYHDSNGNVVSAFDRDETILRLIVEVDMSLGHTASAVVLTNVNYGN